MWCNLAVYTTAHPPTAIGLSVRPFSAKCNNLTSNITGLGFPGIRRGRNHHFHCGSIGVNRVCNIGMASVWYIPLVANSRCSVRLGVMRIYSAASARYCRGRGGGEGKVKVYERYKALNELIGISILARVRP